MGRGDQEFVSLGVWWRAGRIAFVFSFVSVSLAQGLRQRRGGTDFAQKGRAGRGQGGYKKPKIKNWDLCVGERRRTKKAGPLCPVGVPSIR